MGGGPKQKRDGAWLAARDSAERLGPGIGQAAVWLVLGIGLVMALLVEPSTALAAIVRAAQIAFLAFAAWRIALIVASRNPILRASCPDVWPRYTILVALHDEAEVASQLIGRLSRIDYPEERLEAFLLLEAHDWATIEAVAAVSRPEWMSVLIVPPGSPRTKPRALNYGLARAAGDLITVFDAEDHPDPLQLREAAARFHADPTQRLACLQAPLRIRRLRQTVGASRYLDRQFAIEYAALFEVMLPGMARLGLPFPLGGTSNHFRVDALREVGGWDAFNVTEDADLGFRLWREGWRLGVIARPTWETPPHGVACWLPQRTRWLKGYMQTWGVHTRRLGGLGWRGLLALPLTVGAGLVAAGLHAITLAWIAASVLITTVAGLPPLMPPFALGVLLTGAVAAWLQGAIGARRAGVRWGVMDLIASPAYWAFLSLAFVHAVWRLIVEPHAWDKTAHYRDVAETGAAFLDALDAGREAA